MPKLVNLGSLCIDHVYRVPHLTQAGETLASSGHEVFAGGKGLNQSLAARKAGSQVVHVGCVGPDGQLLRDVLEHAGVETGAIRTIADEPSGHAVIQVSDGGENAIVISGGANRCVSFVDVDAAMAELNPNDWLLLQNEINDLPEILERAGDQLARVAFNVAPVDGRERDYDLGGVDLLIVNELEARALVGDESASQNYRKLTERLAADLPDADVVLTLGGEGLFYVRHGRVQHMSAYPVKTVDETAAGDAFIGYMLAGLLAGRSLEQALRAGSAAGALAVTRPGAASSIPDRAAVMSKLGLRIS